MRNILLTLLLLQSFVIASSYTSGKYNDTELYDQFDVFGNNIGRLQVIYEIYDKSGSKSITGEEDIESGFSDIWKNNNIFRRFNRAVVLNFSDGPRTLQMTAQEDYQKIFFAPYILNETSVDGFSFLYKDKRWFSLAGVLAQTSDPVRTSSDSSVAVDWEDLNNKERRYMWGLSTDLKLEDIFRMRKNEIFSINRFSLHYLNHMRLVENGAHLVRGTFSDTAASSWEGNNREVLIGIRAFDYANNPNASAAVYNITSEDGTVTYSSGNDTLTLNEFGAYRETVGNQAVVYKFTLTNTNVARARLKITIAGSYVVQSSFERNYDFDTDKFNEIKTESLAENVLLHSLGGADSYANKETFTVDIGMPTGSINYGADISVRLAGVDISASIAMNRVFSQLPVSGARSSQIYSAKNAFALVGSLEKEVETDAGIFSGKFTLYRIDPGYRTFFAGKHSVVDNDNGNDLSPWYNKQETFEGPNLDINVNGIADFREPFLMYRTLSPLFVNGVDYNNNYLPDFVEDDTIADYPYRIDFTGSHAELRWKKDNLKILVAALQDESISHKGLARQIVADLNFKKTVSSADIKQVIELEQSLQRVQDNIADNTVFVKDSLYGNDPLEMTNSIVSRSYLGSDIELLKKIKITAKYKLIYNKLMSNPTDILLDGGYFYTGIPLQLMKKKLTLTPQYLATSERKMSIGEQEVVPIKDIIYSSPGITATFMLFSQVAVNFGTSLINERNKIFTSASKNSFRLAAEVKANGDISRRPIVFLVGVVYDNIDNYLSATELIERNAQFYIRLHSKW